MSGGGVRAGPAAGRCWGTGAEPGAAPGRRWWGLGRAAQGSCLAHLSKEHANAPMEKRMLIEEMTRLKAEIRGVLQETFLLGLT